MQILPYNSLFEIFAQKKCLPDCIFWFLILDKDKEPKDIKRSLLRSIEELELSVFSYDNLKNAKIHTIADLLQKTEQEMLNSYNFGQKYLKEIKEIMGLRSNMRLKPEDLKKLDAATKKKRNT